MKKVYMWRAIQPHPQAHSELFNYNVQRHAIVNFKNMYTHLILAVLQTYQTTSTMQQLLESQS